MFVFCFLASQAEHVAQFLAAQVLPINNMTMTASSLHQASYKMNYSLNLAEL